MSQTPLPSRRGRSWCTAIALLLPAASGGFVPARAQATRTLTGVVRSTADSAPLAGALIELDHPLGPGLVLSDSTGAFQLPVPAGAARLVVLRLWFRPESLVVSPDSSRVTVWLRPDRVQPPSPGPVPPQG